MNSEYEESKKKYRLRAWVKCAAAVSAAVAYAVAAALILMPGKPQTVGADVGVAEVRNVNLGTLGINNPAQYTDDLPWSGSYVYFGVYNGKPVKFRVLDTRTQEYNAAGDDSTYTMLLDCDNVFEYRMYSNSAVIGWETSDLKHYLNSEKITYDDGTSSDYTDTGFLTTAFTLMERNAIKESTKAEPDRVHNLQYQPLTGQKIFVLDASETEKYGYSGSSNPTASRIKLSEDNSTAVYWWLRSRRRNYEDTNGAVYPTGSVGVHKVSNPNAGYSPVLNLDLSSVAFITAAGNNKASVFEATAAIENNDSWNITIKDSDGFKAERKNVGDWNEEITKGSKITVSVTNVPKLADGSDYTQISAMLTNAAGTVLAYGKVADVAEAGDIEITIPVDIEEGKYSLKVFAEKVRSSSSANLTDYVTNMADISLALISDIDTVEVTGVTAPRALEELDKSAMCADSRVVTTTLGWKLGAEDVSGKADYSKVYTAYATLMPSEGYAFTDSTTATINGNAAQYTILNSDGTLSVAYTFPETEQKPVVVPPVFNLTVNAPEFAEVSAGYERPAAKAVNITNIGNTDADIISVDVDNTEAFEISGSGTTVAVGETLDTWNVQPKSGLSVGTYSGTITVTYNDKKTASANILFKVKTDRITSVEIIDITEPKAGCELDKTAVCTTEGIVTAAPEIFWQIKQENTLSQKAAYGQPAKTVSDLDIIGNDDNTADNTMDNTAAYNRQYMLSITLAAKEGYSFADNVSVFVNGNEAAAQINADGNLVVSYTFPVTEKGVMEKPEISIDYINEVLSGFAADGIYTVGGEIITIADGKAAIDERWFGTELSIVRKSQNDDYMDSGAYLLNMPKRPEAPKITGTDESIYGRNDGSISGVDDTMEYKLALPAKWTDCKGISIDKLSPGIYEVRVKATSSSFAGVSALVEIKPGIYTGTINVISGEGSGTYASGSLLTIKADTPPEGMKFKCWSVVLGDVELADAKNALTTLIAPIGEVQIRAEYETVEQQEENKRPSGDPENNEGNGGNGESGENKATSTGDKTPVVWLLMLMLSSAGVLVLVGRKYIWGNK